MTATITHRSIVVRLPVIRRRPDPVCHVCGGRGLVPVIDAEWLDPPTPILGPCLRCSRRELTRPTREAAAPAAPLSDATPPLPLQAPAEARPAA